MGTLDIWAHEFLDRWAHWMTGHTDKWAHWITGHTDEWAHWITGHTDKWAHWMTGHMTLIFKYPPAPHCVRETVRDISREMPPPLPDRISITFCYFI